MIPQTEDSITGVILAGGRSTRMGGQDKGLLTLANKPMAAYAIQRLHSQVAALIINANRGIADYKALGYPVIEDEIGDFFGPLAGIHATMKAAQTPLIITAPCDSPLLPENYVRRMQTALAEQDAELSVAHNGERLQPVFALLKTRLKDSLQSYLEAGERKIDRWFAKHPMAVVDFSDCPQMFRNINTPQELAVLEVEITTIESSMTSSPMDPKERYNA